jgi:Yip1 domain
MAIVDRIKGICLKPKDEWQVIAGETSTTTDLLKNYALPLAAIGAAASFIGGSFIGRSFLGVSIRTPVVSGLIGAVVGIAASLAIAYILSIIVSELAPKFGAEKNRSQALKVVVYSMTPGWVAGVLGIIPALSILGLVAMGYGIYLLYLGLLNVMKSPPDKVATYTVVVVACGVGLMIVLSLVVGAVAAAGMVTTGALPVVR